VHVGNLSKGILKPCSIGVSGVFDELRLGLLESFGLLSKFTLHAGTNRNIRIALSRKYPSLAVTLFVPVLPHILAGGESGGLDEEFSGGPRVEGFVIDVGRRVGCIFCSGHLKGKAKKRKKKNETMV